MPDSLSPPRVTPSYLCARKARGQKIAALTAYDCPTARLLEGAGIDIALVGDSVGTNVLGYRSEQEVTVEDIVHHTRAVRRGVERALVLADLPFLSYHSPEAALLNAGRLIQEGGADGVKLEGGAPVLPQVEAMTRAGIPVAGHLGFTPQSHGRDLYAFSEKRGTVARVQGRSAAEAEWLLEEARRLQEAGVFALVLEMVAEEAAQLVSQSLEIPTIGIGAGRHCDGQVLIVHDLLGFSGVELRLARAYTRFGEEAARALAAYRHDVEQGAFPAEENVFHMEPGELAQLRQLLAPKS
ncbi:MAG: 3-methyl-2-oxobutanoate hydroxymethyltransferase [Candidatus Handelsmanbacteria bacterium]|nr:3-methyl-2-oxobutanoate hydroxymethyltransferase [Candidatus Handelsmanbacteria bacterium]